MNDSVYIHDTVALLFIFPVFNFDLPAARDCMEEKGFTRNETKIL
jgi:hypothetical protein